MELSNLSLNWLQLFKFTLRRVVQLETSGNKRKYFILLPRSSKDALFTFLHPSKSIFSKLRDLVATNFTTLESTTSDKFWTCKISCKKKYFTLSVLSEGVPKRRVSTPGVRKRANVFKLNFLCRISSFMSFYSLLCNKIIYLT